MFFPRGMEKVKFMSRKFFYGRGQSFGKLWKPQVKILWGNVLGLFYGISTLLLFSIVLRNIWVLFADHITIIMCTTLLSTVISLPFFFEILSLTLFQSNLKFCTSREIFFEIIMTTNDCNSYFFLIGHNLSNNLSWIEIVCVCVWMWLCVCIVWQ